MNGNRWLYSDKPYKLATLSVINQWQLALDNGELPRFIASLCPGIHNMQRCINRYLRWWLIPGRGRSYGELGSLRPGQWSSDVQHCVNPSPFRHSERRAKIALPGDDPQGVVVDPPQRQKETKTVALSDKPAAYDRELVAAVKQFQAARVRG